MTRGTPSLSTSGMKSEVGLCVYTCICCVIGFMSCVWYEPAGHSVHLGIPLFAKTMFRTVNARVFMATRERAKRVSSMLGFYGAQKFGSIMYNCNTDVQRRVDGFVKVCNGVVFILIMML